MGPDDDDDDDDDLKKDRILIFKFIEPWTSINIKNIVHKKN